MPARTCARSDNLCHRINVSTCLHTQHQCFGGCCCNGSYEDIVDELDNFASAMWTDVEDVLFLAHCFKYWQHLLEDFTFATDHNRECAIDRSLRTTTDRGVQKVYSLSRRDLGYLATHRGCDSAHINDNQILARSFHETVWTCDYLFNLRRVRYHGKHNFGRDCNGPRGWRKFCSCVDDLLYLWLLRMACVNGDAMACLQ